MALTAGKPRIADQTTKPTGILTKQNTPVVTSTNKIYSHDLTGVGPTSPSGGGGSVQSGSGYQAPPPPPVTNTGAGAGSGGGGEHADHAGEFGGTDLDALEAQAILDAIAMIEAQTGLTTEQLLADQSEIGRQYRMYLAVAERQHERNREAVANSAVERGLGRSGIHAKQQGDLLQQYIEFQNQQAAQEAAQKAAIDNQIAQAELQDKIAKAQAIEARAGEVLDLETIQAAATGGL